MDEEERGYIFLSHLFAAIPLWGILFNGIIWMTFKERSRRIVFHAHQGIFFQTIFLAAVFMGLVVHLFTKLVGVIDVSLAGIMSSVNILILIIVIIAYEAVCVFAMWNTLQGRDFSYPLIEKRLNR